MAEKKPRRAKKQEAPQKIVGNVRVNIGGNVSGANITIGDFNQASIGTVSAAAETPLPIYKPSDEIPPPSNLPLGSHIPFPRNELFEGRTEELKQLANALLDLTPDPLSSPKGAPERRGGKVVINQTITGMGGIGKTQLAVEFAYRCGRYFRGVHWLNLADPSQLEAEIARNGRGMRLPNFPEDQPSQVTLTLHAWKSGGARLLILDNFEQPARANDVLRLLGHSSLRLLITSRRTDWSPASGLTPLRLDVFSAQESLEFLRKSLTKRKDSDEDLTRLAERLGHLPLALELASRYLNGHPRLSIDEYLIQSREALDHPSMNEWRKEMLAPTPREHDTSLLDTFALSWNNLAGRVGLDTLATNARYSTTEVSQKIFLMAGYLAPNTPIPLEIFEKALTNSKRQRGLSFRAIIDLFKNFSFR